MTAETSDARQGGKRLRRLQTFLDVAYAVLFVDFTIVRALVLLVGTLLLTGLWGWCVLAIYVRIFRTSNRTGYVSYGRHGNSL